MNTVSLSELNPDGREPVFEAPYTVAVGLDAGETIPQHRHAGQDIVFAVQEGTVDLTVGEETVTLAGGDAAAVDGDDGVSVHAETETRALVVLTDRD
jgi:quercetin dioxygenase-like cupin family protein